MIKDGQSSACRGLLDGELAASAPDPILSRTGFYKLEAITKRIALPHHGMNFHVSCGQGELQPNHFGDGDLDGKDGGNPRLADVDGMSAHHLGIARVHANPHIQLVTRMAAGVHAYASRTSCEFTAKVHRASEMLPPCENNRHETA
jgi:hypothetical protein